MLASSSGPDTGTFNYDRVMTGNQGAHEFTHVLGADNTTGNTSNVSYSSITTLIPKYGRATPFDYRHALGGAINEHSKESRARVSTGACCPYPGMRLPTVKVPTGSPRSHSSTRVLVYY